MRILLLLYVLINERINTTNKLECEFCLQENEISAGDFLMVVKNNYYWLKEKSMQVLLRMVIS